MKKYVGPFLSVLKFSEEDVLTTSGFDPNETKEIGTFEDEFTKSFH